MGVEVVNDPNRWPFAVLGFVSGGDGHIGIALAGELVDRSEDRFGVMRVDQVDERLKVAADGVVRRVVLHFAPRGEEDELAAKHGIAEMSYSGDLELSGIDSAASSNRLSSFAVAGVCDP